MSAPAFSITPYQRKERGAVQDLLAHNFYVHTHLDWYEMDTWLADSGSPVRVAHADHRIAAIMGASAPLEGAVWVRIAAVNDRYDAGAALHALWDDLLPELRALGAHQAAILLLRDWPIKFLPALGFSYLEQIITLRRSDAHAPEELVISGCNIRQARDEDIPAIIAIDHAAFMPPWQMGADELMLAERSSAHSTVAVTKAGEIIGYQMSTLYFDGAHMARLAVHPQAQSHGVGHLLTGSMLRYFNKRGVYNISVNTQETNAASQHVYLALGFERNGYDLPVWVAEF